MTGVGAAPQLRGLDGPARLPEAALSPRPYAVGGSEPGARASGIGWAAERRRAAIAAAGRRDFLGHWATPGRGVGRRGRRDGALSRGALLLLRDARAGQEDRTRAQARAQSGHAVPSCFCAHSAPHAAEYRPRRRIAHPHSHKRHTRWLPPPQNPPSICTLRLKAAIRFPTSAATSLQPTNTGPSHGSPLHLRHEQYTRAGRAAARLQA